MSAVDVLDQVIAASDDEGQNALGTELHEKLVSSRAAVAELVEAAKAHRAGSKGCIVFDHEETTAFLAALARITGEGA